MQIKFGLLFILTVLISSIAFGQITIKDDDIQAGQTYNMTANNEYLLDGFVFVEDGATLNIEAGTVIKGKERFPKEKRKLINSCGKNSNLQNGS